MSFPASFNGWFFHKSLSDSKSPQVSKTLLSILIKLNDAFVSMASIMISSSSMASMWSAVHSVFLLSLWEPFQVHQLQLVSQSFSCSTVVVFFSSLTRSKYLLVFSLSFSVSFYSSLENKIYKTAIFFFLTLLVGIGYYYCCYLLL